jgi:hypothetical protein
MEPNKITLARWVNQVSSLDSKLKVYGFSTLSKCTSRFNPKKYSLQQTSITKEVKTITQQMRKFITIKIEGKNQLL